jgi:hypothetical protein
MTDFAAVVAPATVLPPSRPIIIDVNDGPCELCAAQQAGVCYHCRVPIPNYENMNGSGYQSIRPTHYHIEMNMAISTLPIRRSFPVELCRECYRREWTYVYQTDPPV